MKTRIISAFPGTGKSFFHKQNPETTLDSDSSEFSWTYENGVKQRHPDWPENYLDHIKENIGDYKFIFVSSHAEVRKLLVDNCLFFYWINPIPERKEEFIQRYKERGNDEGLKKLLEANWDNWMQQFYLDDGIGCKKVSMILPNLSNELSHIIASEHGDVDE